ncbi:MAG: hypothetical protein FWH47_08230, partial [Methanomassiliicoccaceae archaeon]|nr:hypothetical protein [Methanomassiliicoccaceae archaeon]
DSYGAFKDLCGPGRVWVGLKKNIPGREPAADGEQPDPYLIWMIAPSPDGRHLAVEFAVKQGESAATFVYRVEGDVQRSAADLNRALEAIGFRREAIRLTDEELAAPGNEDYLMAAKRTASLRHVRSCFVGRAVHSSPESWRRKLEELWGGPAPPG